MWGFHKCDAEDPAKSFHSFLNFVGNKSWASPPAHEVEKKFYFDDGSLSDFSSSKTRVCLNGHSAQVFHDLPLRPSPNRHCPPTVKKNRQLRSKPKGKKDPYFLILFSNSLVWF